VVLTPVLHTSGESGVWWGMARRRWSSTTEGFDGFEDLFRLEFGPLVRALTVVAGDREAAADAVQDAFVQAHRHWARVGALESPMGWLRHAALNRIRNQHRGRQRQARALPRLVAVGAVEDAVGGVDATLPLLDNLPHQQRAATALYYLLDQSTAEVAAHLGIAEATVRSHLRAARAHLQREMKDEI
jgi:DNA-directed RNA polymerase specialized sigma24 family protein